MSISTSPAVVTIRGLTREYGKGAAAVRALRGIDLDVRAGEFVALLGRSGSGKSTLLNLLAGLDRPTAGTVTVDGDDLAALSADGLARYRRERVGIVFQSFHLLPGRSALENVATPLLIAGVLHAERGQRALAALDAVGLAPRASHSPAELSGGEQQRVAIARALVREPSLLVCDEPTGNLDSATADGVAELLIELNRDRGVTISMVTHEEALARRVGARIVTMADGRIVAETPA